MTDPKPYPPRERDEAEQDLVLAITDGPIITENISIDSHYRFSKKVKELEAENARLRVRVEGTILSLKKHGQNINVEFHIDWLSEALGKEKE